DIEAFVAESTYLEFFIEGEVTSGTSTRLVITDEFEGIVEQLILTGSFGDYEDGYPTTGIVTGGQYSITGGESFSFSDASITVEAFTSYVINNDLLGLFEDLFGGNDVIKGTAGNDGLAGFDGDDTIDGRAGADTMRGGAGDDFYYVDNAGDLVIEQSGEGVDLVRASIDYTLADNVENLTLKGAAAVTGTGNGLANVIRGTGGDNTLNGLGGNDKLF